MLVCVAGSAGSLGANLLLFDDGSMAGLCSDGRSKPDTGICRKGNRIATRDVGVAEKKVRLSGRADWEQAARPGQGRFLYLIAAIGWEMSEFGAKVMR